jgi:hypothetical protein
MGSRLHKAWRSWQNVGRVRTLQIAVQRYVPSWLFDANSLIAHRVRFDEAELPPPGPDWPHRWASAGDLDLLTQSGIPAETVRGFFRDGAYGAFCEKDGKLVAYTWYLVQPLVVYDWIKIVPRDQPFVLLAYVSPEFRGQGIHLETRLFAYPALAELGYTGIFSFVEHLNRSSLRTGKATPRRYLGRLTYLRILGFAVYRLDGKWGCGIYGPRRPFMLDFDRFDEGNFDFHHKHATSSLDG